MPRLGLRKLREGWCHRYAANPRRRAARKDVMDWIKVTPETMPGKKHHGQSLPVWIRDEAGNEYWHRADWSNERKKFYILSGCVSQLVTHWLDITPPAGAEGAEVGR